MQMFRASSTCNVIVDGRRIGFWHDPRCSKLQKHRSRGRELRLSAERSTPVTLDDHFTINNDKILSLAIE
jgi:hypothetical protein